jgi:hypothetical protein
MALDRDIAYYGLGAERDRLLDPVESHVDQALAEAPRQNVRLAGARVGDARRPPYADASADAALLLGPCTTSPNARRD